jgi:hypothetical protein
MAGLINKAEKVNDVHVPSHTVGHVDSAGPHVKATTAPICRDGGISKEHSQFTKSCLFNSRTGTQTVLKSRGKSRVKAAAGR